MHFFRALFRFRFIAGIQYKAVVGVSCSSIGVLYQVSWQPRSEKHYRLFCFERAHYNVHKYHKTALLFINHFLYSTFLYLLSLFGIFSTLFVCFDILWQLATTHARDNTRDRDANSSRQNDVTWCDFLQGKQVELSLSRSLMQQKTLKIYRSRFALVKKNWARLVSKSINHCAHSLERAY